jgi:hypothetical protein
MRSPTRGPRGLGHEVRAGRLDRDPEQRDRLSRRPGPGADPARAADARDGRGLVEGPPRADGCATRRACATVIADPKSRDSGNTLLHKKFTGGHLTVAGSNSPASLASRPIRIVLFDEVDRFPASAGTEGDPISLGKKARGYILESKVLAGSTPTVKGSSRIEAGFDRRISASTSSRARTAMKCSGSCGRRCDGRKAAARGRSTSARPAARDRRRAEGGDARNGEWRSTQAVQRHRRLPYLGALFAVVDAGRNGRAFLEAKKLPETLQDVDQHLARRDVGREGRHGRARGRTARAARAVHLRHRAAGVLLITVGTDVQDDRLETTIFGWGADEEAGARAHRAARQPGQRGALGRARRHPAAAVPTEDGRTLVIKALRRLRRSLHAAGLRVLRAAQALQRLGDQGRARDRQTDLAEEGEPRGKDAPQSLADRRRHGEGSDLRPLEWRDAARPGIFPFRREHDAGVVRAADVSETAVYKVIQGRRVKYFKPKSQGTRQEALDMTVYAYAALVGAGGERLLRALAMRIQERRRTRRPQTARIWRDADRCRAVVPTRLRKRTRVRQRRRRLTKPKRVSRPGWAGTWRK